MNTPALAKRAAAEFLGTFWLVFAGCGTAVLAGHDVHWIGVALAFGLTVLTMAYQPVVLAPLAATYPLESFCPGR